MSGSGDIEPMGLDKTTTFNSIGGLDEHIQSLKEAVVFPLLYPDLFEKVGIFKFHN
jgi:ATP-dependent 26S proteasome regulatory subunit